MSHHILVEVKWLARRKHLQIKHDLLEGVEGFFEVSYAVVKKSYSARADGPWVFGLKKKDSDC